ncbi:hypothetical protein KC19_2G265600 [Ceratodon purpureus]|uniref:PGG domain-containing protein n=1 Tax=Ceratodon purpureus TaxID=3225 RepID=A0A8T0J0U5_CERPU|nr:hypothetical protein KC19_2G265600 [Ceratodon purpureus]
MADIEVPAAQGVFFTADASSEWYKNLDFRGRCTKLCTLLKRDPKLLHQTGPEGVTALHKAVKHGCVRLAKQILVDMFDTEGNCKCGLNGRTSPCLMRDDLLRKTYSDGVTAVHIAVANGSPKMVLLLKWAIDTSSYIQKNRRGLISESGSIFQDDNMPKSLVDLLDAAKSLDELLDAADLEISDDESSVVSPTAEEATVEEPGVTELATTKEATMEEATVTQAADVTEFDSFLPVVPDVTDEDNDGVYNSDVAAMVRKVYDLIESVLENSSSVNKRKIKALKKECMRDEDFEFSPVAHVFLHFLGKIVMIRLNSGKAQALGIEVIKEIIQACNHCDVEEGGGGGMLKTLFNLHDPQGRTFLHAAYDHAGGYVDNLSSSLPHQLVSIMESSADGISPPIPPATIVECLNARDASGRTLLHYMCIHGTWVSEDTCKVLMEKMDFDATVRPLHGDDQLTLLEWCYPLNQLGDWCSEADGLKCKPIHLIALFNSTTLFEQLFSSGNHTIGGFWYEVPIGWAIDDHPFLVNFICYEVSTPLQIAAYLGRTTLLECMLKHHTKFNSTLDRGLANLPNGVPAIVCAALTGQVEAIQTILKFPVYDPIVGDVLNGTALHVAVKQSNLKVKDLEHLQILASMHTLPNSQPFQRLKEDISRCKGNLVVPRMYSASEKSCINLLLQAGIDIWTPHPRTKQFPTPGPLADDDANTWWYDKVVKEVVDAKTSVSYAANATSVVAALVATASFIGPFQPPLGYSSLDGYIQSDRSPAQVYLVCNSLSFFFSVASILMALLPAIPMPKESLYDELLRSQRCLKASAFMLLVSIMCVLISFSSASIAVVSSDWYQKQIVVASIVFGGAVCIVVLMVYIIRLLRMLFHRNAGIRRRFAKYMYF